MSEKSVSAICITHSSRYGMLQRAILNFLEQQWDNKELLVLSNEEGYFDQIQSFLNDPRLWELNKGQPKNIRTRLSSFRTPVEAFMWAAGWAAGEYLVCWDDDNLSHPQRLAKQIERIRDNTKINLLSQSLYYFYDSDELFITDYAQPSGPLADRAACASVLFHREALPEVDLNVRETWSSHVVDRAGRRRSYELVSCDPTWFLVGSTGDNYRGMALHRKLGSQLPGTFAAAEIEHNMAEIVASLKGYAFPDGKVDACGRDAQACTITELRAWPAWFAPTTPPENWKARVPGKDFMEHQNEERRQQQLQAQAAAKAAQTKTEATTATNA